jgi:type II secretory pathway predicted ATPase ExeA
MYEKFYELERAPFSLLPDPEFLFPTSRHAMALTLLRYSLVAQHSFIVLTGEVGSGKTTVMNKLLDEINDRHAVGVMNFTDRRMSQIWPWILDSLDIPRKGNDKAQMQRDFSSFLIDTRQQGRSTVLIVDEAQNLGPKALENLRMLSNANNNEMLIQTILVGQPEFLETLRRPDLRQLNQRIGVFYRLEPLSELEARQYISHRLEVAGGNPNTFSAEAVAKIWAESGGIARRINTLCDFALVYGYSSGKTIIDDEIVREMLSDRGSYAVATNKPRQNSNSLDEAARIATSNTRYDPQLSEGT